MPYFKMLRPGPVDAATWVGDLRLEHVEAFGRMAGTPIIALGHESGHESGHASGYSQVDLPREEAEKLAEWLCTFLGWKVAKPVACISCGRPTLDTGGIHAAQCTRCAHGLPYQEQKGCPDGGTCHHRCDDQCWRVRHAAPLAIAKFPDGKWPEDVKAYHGAGPMCPVTMGASVDCVTPNNPCWNNPDAVCWDRRDDF